MKYGFSIDAACELFALLWITRVPSNGDGKTVRAGGQEIISVRLGTGESRQDILASKGC
ncbi:MAG: hypothetical protein WBW69_11445 [Candidatus Korobacteraceae bacterium]